jgi:hypothetical protein
MPLSLFRYINNIKEFNYDIKVINSLSSFYYKFFEKITMQFLPVNKKKKFFYLNNLLNLNFH